MCGVMKKSCGNLYNLCMQVRERSEGCSLIGQLLTGWCMLCFGASPSVIMMSRCQILVPCEGDGVGERLPCALLLEACHVTLIPCEGDGVDERLPCALLSEACHVTLVPCKGDGVGERLPCVLLSEAPHVPEREGRGPEEYVSCYHLSCCCWKPGR